MKSPALFLYAMIAVSAAAWLAHVLVCRAREKSLRQLAAQWQMSYVRGDLFNLARRLRGHFPVEGIHDLRVVDLIYGSEGERHRCIFTAEYTCVGQPQPRRRARVACVWEAREAESGGRITPQLAPADLGLLEQYRHFAPSGASKSA